MFCGHVQDSRSFFILTDDLRYTPGPRIYMIMVSAFPTSKCWGQPRLTCRSSNASYFLHASGDESALVQRLLMFHQWSYKNCGSQLFSLVIFVILALNEFYQTINCQWWSRVYFLLCFFLFCFLIDSSNAFHFTFLNFVFDCHVWILSKCRTLPTNGKMLLNRTIAG